MIQKKAITLLLLALLSLASSRNLQMDGLEQDLQDDNESTQQIYQDQKEQQTQPEDKNQQQQQEKQEQCLPAQYIQFSYKTTTTPQQVIPNPYRHPDQQYMQKVQENLNNKNRVCALKYKDKSKKQYQLANFNSSQEAKEAGFIVTHQGVCGKCSTTKDLYVYLTKDLTKPVRQCGLSHFASEHNLRQCIIDLGFTKPCAQVWLWNTLNTKKQCGFICFMSYIFQRPYVIDGELNHCLQCDQDNSGPIFKYQSGRTRRNSGIKSEIDRPSDQIYNITHCYY